MALDFCPHFSPMLAPNKLEMFVQKLHIDNRAKRQLTPEDAVHDREESGTASTIPAARLQCPGPGPRLPSEATAGRQTVSRQGIVSTPPVPRTGTAPSKRSDGGKTNRLAPRDCFRARMRFLLERTPYSRDVVVGPDAYRCWFPHPQRKSCWKQPKW